MGLRNRGVLKLDLIGEIVEGCLSARHAGFGLRNLRFIVRRVDLDQQITGLDALIVARGDFDHLAGDAAAELRCLRTNVGVVRGLSHGVTDPGVPAQRRQCHEDRGGNQACDWNCHPAHQGGHNRRFRSRTGCRGSRRL